MALTFHKIVKPDCTWTVHVMIEGQKILMRQGIEGITLPLTFAKSVHLILGEAIAVLEEQCHHHPKNTNSTK